MLKRLGQCLFQFDCCRFAQMEIGEAQPYLGEELLRGGAPVAPDTGGGLRDADRLSKAEVSRVELETR